MRRWAAKSSRPFWGWCLSATYDILDKFEQLGPSNSEGEVDAASLETDGFIVARDALAPTVCDAFDSALRKCPLTTHADWGVRVAKGCILQEAEAFNLLRSSAGPYSLTGDGVLYDEVVETLDTYPGPYPIHQDSAYFPDASISIAVALSPLGDERGGLWVSPGSHRGGLLPHDKGDFGPELKGDPARWGLQSLSLRRGDAVLIHPHLVHVMIGNSTTQLARLFSAIFH